MEQIVPIGPDEWDLVLGQHSISFPSQDVDSLRRKYHSVARKSIPTGDPNMPEKVRLAKRCKYLIGAKCSLGGGVEEYNMMDNTFSTGTADGTTDDVPANPNFNPEVEVSTSRSSSATASRATSLAPAPVANAVRNNGLVARSSRKKPDFIEIMLLQMNNETAERAHERKERAKDRRQMATIISTIASSFLSAKMRKHKKKKHNRKVVKKKRKNGNSVRICTQYP